MLFKIILILLVAVCCQAKKQNKFVTYDDNAKRDPVDCAAIYLNRKAEDLDLKSRVYGIYPKNGQKMKVFCDMDTDGGGWTVIQRRGVFPPRENFYRAWKDYKEGFGNGNREFWLGNDNISLLTNQDDYELRFDLEDFDGTKKVALYSGFRVADESDKYRMTVDSYINSKAGEDAGDALTYHSGMQFTTKDRDNDQSTRYGNCAQTYKGGWWYKDCHFLNPNGERNNDKYGEGLNWYQWRGYYHSLKGTEMKIRPAYFRTDK